MSQPRKWMIVVGARPQFIKAAALCRAIEHFNKTNPTKTIESEILHTGQHYDQGMSRVFFEEMEIPEPAVNLGVGSGPHGEMTGKMLAGIEREILARQPDCVIVLGDTNSTLAGALAAVKLGVKTVHVEAGLRSFNRAMPEEINRIVADHVSDALFCPSERSRLQLSSEGVAKNVHVVGDVMMDALLHYRPRAMAPAIQGPFALATIHREENVEHPGRLRAILSALGRCPIPVVFAAHPRARRKVEDLALTNFGSVKIVEPLSYFSMLGHLVHCSFVVTDSGGLQKEACYMGKKCVTAREETEWTELVEIGANRVTGAETEAIIEAFRWAMEPPAVKSIPYGDGHASQRVVDILCHEC